MSRRPVRSSTLMPVRQLGSSGMVSFGYNAAAEIRRSPGATPQGGSGDYHLANDRPTLVKYSRGLDRDNALFQGLHRSAITNILGSGFVLQAQTGNKRTDKRLENLWRDWCADPEVRGMDRWRQVEHFALSDMMIAGDIAAILVSKGDHSGKVQMIESERIDHGQTQPKGSGHKMESGLELDRLGRIKRMFVKDYNTHSAQTTGRARGYERSDFTFAANRRRQSQTRGVPALVAAFADINRLSDILSSEAASWQILSRLAVARKQEDAPELAAARSSTDDNDTVETEDLAENVHDVGMALIFNCKPGESIEGISHNIPGPNFTESVRVYLRLLGLPLGLPLELILLDWSQVNYSSARAALEQSFVEFSRWQDRLIDNWHTPILTWLVKRWVAAGDLPDTPTIAKHSWIVPEFPWLDQLKEAQAWGMKLDRGLTTHAEALKSVNRDRQDWLEMREREIAEAAESVARLIEEHAELEPMRAQLVAHFCGLSTKSANKSRTDTETPTSDRPGVDDDGKD